MKLNLITTIIMTQINKLLGIQFDELLSFDNHTKQLCNKISGSLFCSICFLLNLLLLKLASPHTMRSSILIFYSAHTVITSSASLTDIQIFAVKKAIQNEPTTTIFKRLKILPLDRLIKLSKHQFKHSVVFNYAPKSFHNIQLVNENSTIDPNLRNNEHFFVPNPMIELFKRSPVYP